MSDDYSDEGGMSKFNAGLLQMSRINLLQEKINKANINPLSYDFLEGAWNYEVIFNSTTSLFKEVAAKLSPKELAQGIKLKKLIEDGISNYPFIEPKKNNKINLRRWVIFREALFQYEYMIKHYLDKHKMNSPSEDDDEGL